MRSVVFAAALSIVVGLLFSAPRISAVPVVAEEWPPVTLDKTTIKFNETLAQRTTLEFIETPLQDVVDFLKDLHAVEIQIDHRALEDVGVGTDEPVTKNVKGVTLRSALNLMLREMDLTFIIRDEVLLITTPEVAENHKLLRVYNVKPLVDEEHTSEALADVVIATLPYEHVSDEAGAIEVFRELLVVRAPERTHQHVRETLGEIATGLGVQPEKPIIHDPPEPMFVAPRSDAESGEDASSRGDDDAEDVAPEVRDMPLDPFGDGVDPFGDRGPIESSTTPVPIDPMPDLPEEASTAPLE